jgi:hypothetical protein
VGVSIAEAVVCSVCGVGARGEGADPRSVRSSGREGAAGEHADVSRATSIARRCIQVVWWRCGSEHSRSYGV